MPVASLPCSTMNYNVAWSVGPAASIHRYLLAWLIGRGLPGTSESGRRHEPITRSEARFSTFESVSSKDAFAKACILAGPSALDALCLVIKLDNAGVTYHPSTRQYIVVLPWPMIHVQFDTAVR